MCKDEEVLCEQLLKKYGGNLLFSEVLSHGYCFDASGIENPNEWWWSKEEIVNVYYPTIKL